jgi:hypothetical protein
MKNSDFAFFRSLHAPVKPEPATPLSKLLGLGEPPPAVIPSIGPTDFPPIGAPRPLSSLIGASKPFTPLPSLDWSSIGSLLEAPESQPAVAAPKGIRFLDATFSEPEFLFSSSLPKLAGLYVILVLDFNCNPRPYRPLYFGKANDLAARVTRSHEKYSDWSRAAGSGGLLVSYYITGISEWWRNDLEEKLIKHYTPQCNSTFNPFAEFLGK